MLLFLYGVLLDSVAEGSVRHLLRGLGPGQPATTCGELYAIAERGAFYPALVSGKGTVRGMLHAVGSADLVALDRFEDAEHLQGEYRREPVTARLVGGKEVQAFAYLYNHPATRALIRIPGGDFAGWLRANGALPFAG